MSVYKKEKKGRKDKEERDVQPRDTHGKQTISYGVQNKKNNILSEFRIVKRCLLLCCSLVVCTDAKKCKTSK